MIAKRLILLATLMLTACTAGPRGALPPVVQETPPAAANSYVVQPGDSIYSVARELHLSVRALIDANQLRAPYQLQPGQRLSLPGNGFYLVGKGDTLLVIARKTGVPFATLARMNDLKAPYVLQVGQKLQLPASSATPPLLAAAVPVTAARPIAARPPAIAAAPLPPVTAAPLPAAPAPPSAAAPMLKMPLAPPAMSVAPPPGAVTAPPPASVAAPPPPAIAPPPEAAASAPPMMAAVTPLPPPPAKSGHGFIWPVKGEVIAEFGTTGKGQHNDGINIAAPRGSPVVAAESGVVAYAGNELRGFGNLLLIKHEDGWMTAYAHNDSLLVRRGDVVRRGQKIATVGDSGGVSQPQLHFELRQGTRAIDPAPILAGKPLPSVAPVDPPEPG